MGTASRLPPVDLISNRAYALNSSSPSLLIFIRHLLVGCTLAGSATAQVTLIDVAFPSGTGTNPTFLEIDNGVGSNNTWKQSTGVLETSQTSNSTAGAASDLTIDFPSLGDDALTLTVVVPSRTGTNSANGMFIGFQQRNAGGTGTDLWNNTPPSFGLVIPGNASGGLVFNRVSVGGNDPSTPGRYQAGPGWGTASGPSLADGFTVTLTVDNTGWSVVLTGLETTGGSPITGGSGSWGTNGINDWNEFNNQMRAGFSYQTDAGGGDLNISQHHPRQDPQPRYRHGRNVGRL